MSMCPHCGRLFTQLVKGRLIPTHDHPPPCRAVCPGSGQNPRNSETDRRPLWSGQSNPHLQSTTEARHDTE